MNRNFGFGWGLGGASADPCDPNYEGPEPWSEVEAVAVREYLLSLDPRPVFYQNLHADLQMITFPWGYTCEEDSPEAADLDAVAVKVQKNNIGLQQRKKEVRRIFLFLPMQGNDAVFAAGGRSFALGQFCQTMYQATGTAVDFAHGEAGIKYSYTVELRNETLGGQTLARPEDIEPNAREFIAFHASAARDIKAEFGGGTD